MRIGYVGLGNMGGPLARRLLLSQPLAVYDRDPGAVACTVAKGGQAASGLGNLAANCDVVLLCLPTSAHVRAAIFDADGLASTAKPGTLIVDQTTGDPLATREMAKELASRGIELIDAPVSGGPRGAENGTIAIMVGGSAEQYARIEPILKAISPNVFHAGGVGTGHVAKLANNMLSAAQRIASMESMALAVKNGIEPRRACEILMAGSGRNFFVEHFMGSHIITGKLHSGFTLGLLHKDVSLACQLGHESDVTLLFGNLAREYYQMAINEFGRDTQVNAVALVVDRLAGVHVVPEDYQLG